LIPSGTGGPASTGAGGGAGFGAALAIVGSGLGAAADAVGVSLATGSGLGGCVSEVQAARTTVDTTRENGRIMSGRNVPGFPARC